jgi:hypothetical protein
MTADSAVGFGSAVMSERDGGFTREQKLALQRLATLQRMREDARRSNRAAMLKSIESLIEVETKVLREHREPHDMKKGSPPSR